MKITCTQDEWAALEKLLSMTYKTSTIYNSEEFDCDVFTLSNGHLILNIIGNFEGSFVVEDEEDERKL